MFNKIINLKNEDMFGISRFSGEYYQYCEDRIDITIGAGYKEILEKAGYKNVEDPVVCKRIGKDIVIFAVRDFPLVPVVHVIYICGKPFAILNVDIAEYSHPREVRTSYSITYFNQGGKNNGF